MSDFKKLFSDRKPTKPPCPKNHYELKGYCNARSKNAGEEEKKSKPISLVFRIKGLKIDQDGMPEKDADGDFIPDGDLVKANFTEYVGKYVKDKPSACYRYWFLQPSEVYKCLILDSPDDEKVTMGFLYIGEDGEATPKDWNEVVSIFDSPVDDSDLDPTE